MPGLPKNDPVVPQLLSAVHGLHLVPPEPGVTRDHYLVEWEPAAPASSPDTVRHSQPGPDSIIRCLWAILKGLLSSNGAAALSPKVFRPLGPVVKREARLSPGLDSR